MEIVWKWNTLESLETNLCTQGNMAYDKGFLLIKYKKNGLLESANSNAH